MRINHLGKVGIGETSPDMYLHIKVDGNDGIKIESTNSNGPGYMYLQRNTDGKSYMINQSNHPLILGANNKFNQLYLKENGNVGIGETSPDMKLHIKVDGNDGIKIESTGPGYMYVQRNTDGKSYMINQSNL